MSNKTETCNKRLSWWDGEYEGECELPEGHRGPHYDGLSSFTDEGDEVELKTRPLRPTLFKVTYSKNGRTIAEHVQVLDSMNKIMAFEPEARTVVQVEVNPL